MNKTTTREQLQEYEAQLYYANLKLLGLDGRKDCSSELYVERFISSMQKKACGGTIQGIPSGFKEIDYQTGGWQDADFIVIAGEPSIGKTAFSLSMVKYIAVENQLPIAYFSLAQTAECLIGRLVSNIGEITNEKIQKARFTNEEWEKLDKAAGLISKAPLYIIDTLGLNVFDIKTMARYLVHEKGIKMMIIDNLHLINVGNRIANSRQEEYRYINVELKRLSLELNIPILVICETPPLYNAERDLLERVHGFGAIEQYADMVLFLQHPGQRHSVLDYKTFCQNEKREVVFAKYRDGQTSPFTLRFRSEYSRFENDGTPKSDKEVSDDDIPF